MWEVISSSSKGRMMVATEAIKSGHLVHRELPTAYVPSYDVRSADANSKLYSPMERSMLSAAYQANGDQFKGYVVILASRLLTAANNDELIRKNVEALCRSTPHSDLCDSSDIVASANILKRLLLGTSVQEYSLGTCIEILEKLQSNAFSVVDFDLTTIAGIGLYAQAAAVNHSCDPNCFQSFDILSSSTLSIRSCRDIKKGEEITIAYIDVGAPTWWRQKELLSSYGFYCSCSRCTVQDTLDIYPCLTPNCKGVLEVVGRDIFLNWLNNSNSNCSSQGRSIEHKYRETGNTVANFIIPFPRGDLLLKCTNRADEKNGSSHSHVSMLLSQTSTSTCPSSSSISPTLSPPSSSSSLHSTCNTLRNSTEDEENKTNKLRLKCDYCQNILNIEDISKRIKKISSSIHKIKNEPNLIIRNREIQSCLEKLEKFVKPSHYCVVRFLKEFILDDLILQNNFQCYVQTVRSSNYLKNVKMMYPLNHPFPAIQAAMYSKSLIAIGQYETDFREARTYLQEALEVLLKSHGEETSLVRNVHEMLYGF